MYINNNDNLINDNLDNFRSNQLPRATREIFNNNINNNYPTIETMYINNNDNLINDNLDNLRPNQLPRSLGG